MQKSAARRFERAGDGAFGYGRNKRALTGFGQRPEAAERAARAVVCTAGPVGGIRRRCGRSQSCPLLQEMFVFIRDYEGEVPGAAAKDCGNYLDQNLGMAKWQAKKYLDTCLYCIREENLVYPK